MDPGPLTLIDPQTLTPFPPAPSFEGIVARHLANLSGADAAFVQAKSDAAASPPDDVAPLYASTIGPAEARAANEANSGQTAPIPALLANAETADAVRVNAAPYLPGADAPIEQSFEAPPAAPDDIGTPGGVEQPPEGPPQI